MAQRQFRSDDTSPWIFAFGDGSDGAYSSVGNATDAPVDSSCSGASGATSLSATNASFAAGKPILIHQSRGTGAGAWELNQISGYTAGTITTRLPLTNTYTDSGASQAQVIQLKQYSSFTQNSGHTLTAKAWDGNVGGIIAFLCNGTTTITGTLSGAGKGFRGGSGGVDHATAYSGEGTSGASSQTQSANGNGGGGGVWRSGFNYGGLGGGGGYAANGYAQGVAWAGAGGSSVGEAAITTLILGGASGGSGANSGTGGAGGNGGGAILIISKDISISGSITVNGGAGGNATGSESSGGVGGTGGAVLLKAQTATLGTTKITSSGGAAGSQTSNGYDGQTGGVGRIHLDYLTSYTGTTTPTIDVTQDLSLKNYSYLSAFML
jgi:hypothetical protein